MNVFYQPVKQWSQLANVLSTSYILIRFAIHFQAPTGNFMCFFDYKK